MVFIRKLLYVVLCYFLIRIALAGRGLYDTVVTEIFLVGVAIIMKPTNWERGLINWKKLFDFSAEDEKEQEGK